MILAFMVMWDLPNIQRGVASLETSRLSGVYREVAPTFGVFGSLFGKALQAQVKRHVHENLSRAALARCSCMESRGFPYVGTGYACS